MDVITAYIGEDTPGGDVICRRLGTLQQQPSISGKKIGTIVGEDGECWTQVKLFKTEYLPPAGEDGNILMKKYSSDEMETLPRCTQFKYLGTTIHQEGGCRKEVELRILKAWNKWRELSGVLCDRKMPAHLTILIYKISIRPALAYGIEAWPVTGTRNDKVGSCEMRM